MKCAYILLIGLAAVSYASAAPHYLESDTYVTDHIKGLWDLIKGRSVKHIDDLKTKWEELRKQLNEAKDVARDELRKKLDDVTVQMKDAYNDLLEKMKDIFKNNEEDTTYFNDALIGRIRELRQRLAQKTKELAQIIKEQSKDASDKASEHFRQKKEFVLRELDRIKEQLMAMLRKLLVADDEEKSYDMQTYGITADTQTYGITADMQAYGITADILDHLRAKVEDIKLKIADIRGQLRDAAGQRKAELRKHLAKLQHELQGAWSDIKAALREIFATDSAYSVMDDSNDLYVIDTVIELRKKLNEKLEQIKEYAEIAKSGGAAARKVFDALREEATVLKNEIVEQLREIFERQ